MPDPRLLTSPLQHGSNTGCPQRPLASGTKPQVGQCGLRMPSAYPQVSTERDRSLRTDRDRTISPTFPMHKNRIGVEVKIVKIDERFSLTTPRVEVRPNNRVIATILKGLSRAHIQKRGHHLERNNGDRHLFKLRCLSSVHRRSIDLVFVHQPVIERSQAAIVVVRIARTRALNQSANVVANCRRRDISRTAFAFPFDRPLTEKSQGVKIIPNGVRRFVVSDKRPPPLVTQHLPLARRVCVSRQLHSDTPDSSPHEPAAVIGETSISPESTSHAKNMRNDR
jgi:hypothetical protein